MDKYADLQKELVSSLTERLLDIEFELGKRSCFFTDIAIDHHMFDILADHLWERTAFAETISELIESKEEQNAFDRRARGRVYDELYKAVGGLT